MAWRNQTFRHFSSQKTQRDFSWRKKKNQLPILKRIQLISCFAGRGFLESDTAPASPAEFQPQPRTTQIPFPSLNKSISFHSNSNLFLFSLTLWSFPFLPSKVRFRCDTSVQLKRPNPNPRATHSPRALWPYLLSKSFGKTTSKMNQNEFISNVTSLFVNLAIIEHFLCGKNLRTGPGAELHLRHNEQSLQISSNLKKLGNKSKITHVTYNKSSLLKASFPEPFQGGQLFSSIFLNVPCFLWFAFSTRLRIQRLRLGRLRPPKELQSKLQPQIRETSVGVGLSKPQNFGKMRKGSSWILQNIWYIILKKESFFKFFCFAINKYLNYSGTPNGRTSLLDSTADLRRSAADWRSLATQPQP